MKIKLKVKTINLCKSYLNNTLWSTNYLIIKNDII